MRDKLRRRYQVHKEVSRNGCFEGEIRVADLKRLTGLLYSGNSTRAPGGVRVEFEFVRNEYGLPMIRGRLTTRLELECQRCLGTIEYPLDLEMRLLVDASDDVVRDSSLDTIYSVEDCIDIFEVVEDELILAVPLVARHDDRACNEHWPADANTETATAAADNPFAVLQVLKTND